MSIFDTWTQSQWTAFSGLSIAGLSALGLAVIAFRTVRSWTAPATHTAPPSRPRPSIEAAARRTLLPDLDIVRRPVVRADEAAHLQPGPGSITSVLAEEGIFGPRDDGTEIDADVRTLFARWEDGWRRSVNAALAPAMLKAVMWAIEGEQAGVSGAGHLQEWYQNTPTGGWPIIAPATPAPNWHPYATAC